MPCCAQSGVEVGVFIKKAMEGAGVTSLAQLSAAELCAALREYETVRSHRVSYIIKKSLSRGGGMIRKRGWLVRARLRARRMSCAQLWPDRACMHACSALLRHTAGWKGEQ